MVEKEFHFITTNVMNKLMDVGKKYCDGNLNAEQFLMKTKELLPVHKTDRETWKARVEGMSEITEKLIDCLVEKGREVNGTDWSREDVIKQAKLRPLSYYHYVTGSREPEANVRTSDDYFNDPTTALVKLEDDILSLCRLLKKYM